MVKNNDIIDRTYTLTYIYIFFKTSKIIFNIIIYLNIEKT